MSQPAENPAPAPAPSNPPSDLEALAALVEQCDQWLRFHAPDGFMRRALAHMRLARDLPEKWARVGIDAPLYSELETMWDRARQIGTRCRALAELPALPKADCLLHEALNFAVAIQNYSSRLLENRRARVAERNARTPSQMATHPQSPNPLRLLIERERAERRHATEAAQVREARRTRFDAFRAEWDAAWAHLMATAQSKAAPGALAAALVGLGPVLSRLHQYRPDLVRRTVSQRLHAMAEADWALPGPAAAAALLELALDPANVDVLTEQFADAVGTYTVRAGLSWIEFFQDQLLARPTKPHPSGCEEYEEALPRGQYHRDDLTKATWWLSPAALSAEVYPGPGALASGLARVDAPALVAPLPASAAPAMPNEPAAPATAFPNGGEPMPATNANWRAAIDARVSQLHCTRPPGLDPALGDVYEGVARAYRECSRLIASVPYLWERPDDYRVLAASVTTAAAAAKAAYMAVDVRLRRAGGENVALGALNDALTISSNAPATPKTVGALNPVLVQLHTNRAEWFPPVDGRGVLDRLVEQLARVPPEVPAAPVRADWVAELDRLIDLFVRGNEACVLSPVVLLAVPAGNVDTRAALRDPSAPPLVADAVLPVIEGMTHAETVGCATVQSATATESVILHVVAGGTEPKASIARFLELAAESGRLSQRLPSETGQSSETTSPRNLWCALVFGHLRGTAHLCHHSAQDYDFAPHPFVASAELLKRFRERFVARSVPRASPAPAAQVPAKPAGKGKNIDARMLKQLADDHSSASWSARQWAVFLECSDGTVKDTKTWKERLKAVRSLQAADSALTRSKLPPAGKRKARKR